MRIDGTGEAPAVPFDPLRATQVLENLVGNAIAHGGRDDLRIGIEVARSADGGVTVVVGDDGVGVADDDRDRIFDVFQRGRGASTGGNGLGLALVRRIVEVAGGTVELDPGGAGARFVVTFPASHAEAGADVDAALA